MRAVKAMEAISSFDGEIFDAHHPAHMWCGCIDGREKGGGNLKLDDITVRVTEIAASFPPYKDASPGIRAKFSFRKIKGVKVIMLSGHSDCGGAQTAIAYPDEKNAPDEDVANIVHTLAYTGVDLPHLAKSFLALVEGDTQLAAELLARHITLVSLDNISGYPHVNEQIMNDELDVIPLFHVMKRGTGQRSHLERYDVAKQMWIPTSHKMDTTITNMCERPNHCKACASCHATIERSLKWSPVLAILEEDKTQIVDVPYHIARLVTANRAVYQPKLNALIESGAIGGKEGVTPIPLTSDHGVVNENHCGVDLYRPARRIHSS